MLKKSHKLIIVIFSLILVLSLAYLTYAWIMKPRYRNIDLKDFGSTDAKFFKDGYIVTSKEKKLTFINTRDGSIDQTKVASNWVDCLPEENLIIYSNERGKVGVCIYDIKNRQITKNKLIFSDNFLRIDPSIVKIGEMYYMTLTKILGEVNRSDPNVPNGMYTIQLFKSYDTENWKLVSNIITRDHNLEDVKLNSFNNKLSIMYEVETLDKQVSTIEYLESNDEGLNWGNPQTLVDSNGDNEPATIFYMNKKYYVFYSSDLERPGEAYSGSNAFLNIYNSTFNLIKQEKLLTSKDSRILLFEALCNQNEATLLYSYDYLDNDDLIVETDIAINK